MAKREDIGGIFVWKFDCLSDCGEWLSHGVFERWGGVSDGSFNSLNVRLGIGDEEECVWENRKRVMDVLGVNFLVAGDQVHGRKVAVIGEGFVAGGADVEGVDGFVCGKSEVGVMMQVADCQAILFVDKAKKVLGLAHAGWRGLQQNISAEVIAKMKEEFGSAEKDIWVGIGPSLGPESAEFSDPIMELGKDFEEYIEGKLVDLWGFSKAQLVELGIPEEQIEMMEIDTAGAGGKDFFSYRREGKVTGRFALAAALKN